VSCRLATYRPSLHDALPILRDAALEVISLARAQHAHLAADGHLDLTGDDDAALLALVHDHRLAGVAAWRHHLAQDAHLPLGPVRSEEHTSELQSRENLVCRL